MESMSMTDGMMTMASTTASGLMATASAAMDHSNHSSLSSSSSSSMDHDMGGMMGGCRISMLWNWNTIDACFISSSWRISSAGMFAGSCIGVMLLVISLEMLRRLRASYDRYLVREFQAGFGRNGSRTCDGRGGAAAAAAAAAADGKGGGPAATTSSLDGVSPAASTDGITAVAAAGGARTKFRPRLWQQIIRSLLHMVQFGVAYFIMLLAMYYNGYFIICILIGAFLGHFIFDFHLTGSGEGDATGSCG